jgi:hypothetical protein
MLVNSLPNENGVLVALPPSVRDRLRPSLKRVRLEAVSDRQKMKEFGPQSE